MIRGKTSGALGRIVKYTRQDTAGNDAVEVVLEEPQVFSVGEELEYGNFTKTTQITIHVETTLEEMIETLNLMVIEESLVQISQIMKIFKGSYQVEIIIMLLN